MKLTQNDIFELKKALIVANKAGLDSLVIHEGLVRGLNENQNAAIFSPIALSIDKNIQFGVQRIGELSKRLELFGDEVLIEGELNDAKKVRKLTIRGKAGKVDFRCTDPKLITYPKTNADQPGFRMKITKPEVALLSKGIKLLGGEQLVLQVKRDGSVHIECSDSNNDRFELNLTEPVEYEDEAYPFVQMYDSGSKGVFIGLLEQLAKDLDTISLAFMKSGNVGFTLYGFDMLAIPRIKTGDTR